MEAVSVQPAVSHSAAVAHTRAHDVAVQIESGRPFASEVSWLWEGMNSSSAASQDQKKSVDVQAIEAVFATYE